MRAAWCGCLVLALTMSQVTACGRVVAPMAASRVMTPYARAMAEGDDFAQQFYDRLQGHVQGSVTIDGRVVTVLAAPQPGDDGVTRYDFTQTAGTHLVDVHTAAFDTKVSFDELMASQSPDGVTAKFLPVLLVPVALRMASAAVEAFTIYWMGHRGDQFNREDCVKAMAVGMAAAMVPFLGELKWAKHLVPIASKILGSAPSLDAATIAKAVIPLIGAIVVALKSMLDDEKNLPSPSPTP